MCGSYKVSTVDSNEFLDAFADNIDIESEQTKLLTLVRLIHLENSNVWDLFLSRNFKKDSIMLSVHYSIILKLNTKIHLETDLVN